MFYDLFSTFQRMLFCKKKSKIKVSLIELWVGGFPQGSCMRLVW